MRSSMKTQTRTLVGNHSLVGTNRIPETGTREITVSDQDPDSSMKTQHHGLRTVPNRGNFAATVNVIEQVDPL